MRRDQVFRFLWQFIFLTKTVWKTKNYTALISFSDNFKAAMRTDNCRKCFPLLLKVEPCVPAMAHWWQARRKTILVPKPPLADALHEEATEASSLCIASSTGTQIVKIESLPSDGGSLLPASQVIHGCSSAKSTCQVREEDGATRSYISIATIQYCLHYCGLWT